ncbi:hypothetical protein Tco_1303035 [Tanacetum coccineum]
MGGSSSQPRTDPTMSPINAFLIKDLYTPEFSKSLEENTGYWQEPNPHEEMGEQVTTSPMKKKKPNRNRQKRTIQTDDEPWQIAWTTEEEIALAKGWVAFSENNKHSNARKQDGFWCEMRCKKFDDQGAGTKRELLGKKGSKTSGSSTMNDDALARLMVAAQEYRAQQEDIRFYLQPYDHLTEDQWLAMYEAGAKMKAKYDL